MQVGARDGTCMTRCPASRYQQEQVGTRVLKSSRCRDARARRQAQLLVCARVDGFVNEGNGAMRRREWQGTRREYMRCKEPGGLPAREGLAKEAMLHDCALRGRSNPGRRAVCAHYLTGCTFPLASSTPTQQNQEAPRARALPSVRSRSRAPVIRSCGRAAQPRVRPAPLPAGPLQLPTNTHAAPLAAALPYARNAHPPEAPSPSPAPPALLRSPLGYYLSNRPLSHARA